MKKFIGIALIICMLCASAMAEIDLEPNADRIDDQSFAALYKAQSAATDAKTGVTYYLKDGGVYAYEAASSTEKQVYSLPANAEYAGLRLGAEGCLYLIKRNADETAKAGILCLTPEGDGYSEFEYLLPGCVKNIRLLDFDMNAETQNGYLLMELTGASGSMRCLSVFGSFWGVLDGYDCVIFQRADSQYADMLELETLFDVYGYINDEFSVYLDSVSAGSLLAFGSACLSPDGRMLIATTSNAVYVLELDSLRAERIALPDGFSGKLRWAGNLILAIPADGSESFYPEFSGFADTAEPITDTGEEWYTEGDWTDGGWDSGEKLDDLGEEQKGTESGWN